MKGHFSQYSLLEGEIKGRAQISFCCLTGNDIDVLYMWLLSSLKMREALLRTLFH